MGNDLAPVSILAVEIPLGWPMTIRKVTLHLSAIMPTPPTPHSAAADVEALGQCPLSHGRDNGD
jgi:hypothetical protein